MENAGRVEIRRGRADDAAEIAPLMEQFNQAEDIVWEPDTMLPALRRLLESKELGCVLVARDETSQALVGYALATFGYDIAFAG